MTLTAISTPFGSGETHSIGAAAEWLSALATGSLAATLCVIAVAFLGFLMFSGRVPVRAGFTVVLGCFVLLGAPVISGALIGFGSRHSAEYHPARAVAIPGEREPLPQSTYDPYAGASLRRD